MLGDCRKNRPSLAAMVAMAMTVIAVPEVWATENRVMLDLPAQSLASALESLATATHTQFLYSAELVRGRNAPAVKGPLTGTNLFDNEYWAKMLTSTNNLYGEPRSFVLAIKASM